MEVDADWTARGDYMRARHGVQGGWANEALIYPDRIVIVPDPGEQVGPW